MATQKSTAGETKPQEEQGANVPARTGPTAPARYRPGTSLSAFGWEPIRRLREEFDRIFDQAFNWPVPWEETGRVRQWGLDVQESEDNVVVRAEAPGFEPDDFDLQVRNDQLVLKAAHRAEAKESERGYREWHQQEFYRSVALPPGIDVDNVQATYRHGVLTMTLPKTEQSKGRRITVQG